MELILNYLNKKKFLKKKIKFRFSESTNHDWRKGFSEFIIPASKINNVNLIHASKSGDNLIKLENMPNFYEEIDLYILHLPQRVFIKCFGSFCNRNTNYFN